MSEVWKPSVTVAAIVEKDGKFLVVEEHTTDGIKLNQPAGHLDPGETPQAGAVRECLEESAWEITPSGLIGIYMNRYTSTRTGQDVTYLRFAFACQAVREHTHRTLDSEIIRTHWLSHEELVNSQSDHRSPLVLRCVEDYLACKAGHKTMTPLDNVFTHPSVLNGPMPPGAS
ncbi:MAG: NUDIX hydrolase [Limnobacter sp.]|nr:NUDIX hydrolase [Limnobacter sp.]